MLELKKLDGFERIYFVDSFFKEFKKLFNKDAQAYNKYIAKLNEHLTILDNSESSLTLPRFEPLKNEKNLLAIRFVSKLNVRVIFSIEANGTIVLLLTSFKEKSTSDYNSAINRAKKYVKELEG